MSWKWWQPDPDGREHAEAWWAESEALHLTVCGAADGRAFRWIVCGAAGGQVLASGDADTVAEARQACEAAAAGCAPQSEPQGDASAR